MKPYFILFLSLLFSFQPELHSQSTGSDYISWFSVEEPTSAHISVNGNVTINLTCYIKDVTSSMVEDSRISVWIGVNATNTNPNTWTNWTKASFSSGNYWAHLYTATIGSILSAGIYYYAARVQFNGGPYRFAGLGSFWDGVTNKSGMLAVGKPMASISLSNTLQRYDGKAKKITAVTNPSGQQVNITYNGSTTIPVNEGSYKISAVIDNSATYQGNATETLTIYKVAEDSTSVAFRNKFIWLMFDPLRNQSDLDSAIAFHPDGVVRTWFKWETFGDYAWKSFGWMPKQANEHNITFGGGGGIAQIFEHEVGATKFQNYVDRTISNQPMHFLKDTTLYYHSGDLQNKEYLDFMLKGWIPNQIDMGINTLFIDGIGGAPSIGYSDSCMAAFNRYLIGKYKWGVNDNRWQLTFGISFTDDCTDHTMNTFNYRNYLLRYGFEKDPYSYWNLLAREFGDPFNWLGTFSEVKINECSRYLYQSIKRYTKSKGVDVSVTMNGFSSDVDYQTTGIWNNWIVTAGKLDIAPSYVREWRKIKDYSIVKMQRDLPLLVFHDWGFGMPFIDEIDDADRLLWLRVYAPEIFASGSIFMWPFAGGGYYYPHSLTLENAMRPLISWYSQNRNLYIGSAWISDSSVNLKGQKDLVQTLLYQYNTQGDTTKQMVHLINKQLDTNRKLVNRDNLSIRVSSGRKPVSVWAASPDFNDFQKLDFTWSGDTAEILVKSLEAYTVVVLDYLKKVPQRIYFDKIPQMKPGDPDYTLKALASSGLPVTYSSSKPAIASIDNGKIHITGSGTFTVTASQSGDATYDVAPNVSQSIVTDGSTGEQELKTNSIQIFPNPCTDIVNLKSDIDEPFHVQLTDMLGKSYFNGTLRNNELDVKSLPRGIYIIKINGSYFKLMKNQ